MINKKKYGILLLQVSIILLAFLVVPASANEPPVVIEGELLVDGDPAAIGTKVAIVSEGNTIAETTVTKEGVFGDERSNRLGIHSSYEVVTVYVNGVKTQTLDLNEYETEDIVSMDITANSPATNDESNDEKATSASTGGGVGFSSANVEEETPAKDIEEEVPAEEIEEETVLPSTSDEIPVEGESEPLNTSQTSSALVLFGIVLVSAGVGIYMYMGKK